MEYELYEGTHTGGQVDDGLDKALNPDSAPVSSSDNLITSGGVYAAIANEATQRNNAIQQAISDIMPNKVATTLAAASWSGNVYSFESTYPATDYDLTVEVANTATAAQYEAFAAGLITGSATNNAITALGVIPSVDIPIILTVALLGA